MVTSLPGPGNGRANTSFWPDLLDTYATQRPSGEKIAPRSSNGVSTKGVAVHLSPSTLSITRSRVSVMPVVYSARTRPSGDHEVGYLRGPTSSSVWSPPLP